LKNNLYSCTFSLKQKQSENKKSESAGLEEPCEPVKIDGLCCLFVCLFGSICLLVWVMGAQSDCSRSKKKKRKKEKTKKKRKENLILIISLS